MTKRPIIIDTDPGIDDAVALAIALFSEELDVKLLTTVPGNVGLDNVTDNMLKILDYVEKDVSVAMGAHEPLLKEMSDASSVHGLSGMEGFDFKPATKRLLLEEHAITAMRREILSSAEPITLVPIGPLTNIALLFKVYPEVKTNIKEIVLMGGSITRGNKGVMAEFNIYFDPDAAKIVFMSGVPIVMAGLDVGMKALVLPEDSAKIKDMNKTGTMIYSLFKHYRGGSMQTGLKMYDSCAIAYLLKPELFEAVETFVDVETKGELTEGCTVVDLKGYLGKEPNATVLTDIDSDAFRRWFVDSINTCI